MFNAGVRGKRSKDTTGIITVGEHFNQQNFLVPTVTRFAVTDGSYVDTNDAAADTAGSQTIVLYGSGFAPGATVLVGSTTIGAVTFLDSGRLAFSSPALGSGSYTIFVTNANGGTGILVPGLVYSGVPTFTTSAGSLGSVYETTAISTTVVATGDAPITYAISSGSLPSGSTLSSSGTISGTAPVDGSSTTYSFTIQATDADNQDSVRSFSLTINTDVVSFSSPANNTTTTATQNSPISNVTPVATSAAGYGVLYTSSGLPTGLSMDTSTGIISGTPTVVASNTSIITATANTTSRTAALYLNWTINLPGDVFWKYASLLMSANSAPNGNTFNTDASTINNEIVVVADTKPNEFHPFKEGYYSNLFDGTGDYLAILTSSAFNIATNSFTVEAWINTSSATQQTIFNISDTGSTGYGAVRVQVLADKTVQWLMGPGSSWGVAVTAGSIVLGAWNHIAITRNGSSVYFFINGLQVGTTQTYATSLTTGGTTYIGYNSGTAYGFNGYISNLRFVNGTALYTANTTLSTAPLTYVANTSLLTCQSSRLIDNSNNNFTITKGGDTKVNPFSPFNGTPTTVTVPGANNYSVYFDGTGDYLSFSSNSAFGFGTGDFTVEYWVYSISWATAPTVVDLRTPSGSSLQWSDNFSAGGAPGMYYNATQVLTSSITIPLRTWAHVAYTREGSTVKVWVNGVQGATGTSSFNLQATGGFSIGTNNGNANPFNGYVSNIRILKGTALYTTTFTPPAGPLTVIANTSLLTAQANTIIDSSNNGITFTVSGDARPARNGPFANTSTVTLIGSEGSAYFDGTGDYLSMSAVGNPLDWPASANYTIEAWVYLNAFTGSESSNILARRNPTSTTTDWQFYISTSGALGLYNLNGSTTITASSNMAIRQWNHCAAVISAGTATLYLNGAKVSTATAISAASTASISTYIVGASNSVYLNGYISNLRVTKGTALYTTPFVPSWAPLTPVANTVLLTAQTNLSSNTKVIVDESNLNNIVSGFGNSNLGTFSPFGSSRSVYFDGTGDYLSLPTNTALNFSTGDFTLEGWVYQTSTAADWFLISASGSGGLFFGYTSGYGIGWGRAGVAWDYNSTGVGGGLGVWNHMALTRSGTSMRIFYNGTQVGTTQTLATAYNLGTTSTTIGSQGANYYLPGYISNLRVIKGTALYTANFTPSTTPLVPVANTVLLTCNSNQFVDYSATNNAITRNGDAVVSEFSPFSSVTVTPASYSGYFDGTGDYIQLPSNAWTTLAGQFTIEFFVNFQAAPSGSQPLTGTVSTAGAFSIYFDGTRITPNLYGTGNIFNSTFLGSGIVFGKWYHIAVTRNSSNLMTMWVDGVSVGSATTATTYSETIWRIGESNFNCFISNFRATNTTVYTATFTPPTAPLTAISGTSLLTCQSTTFIDNSTNNFAITVTGNAKPVIQNPFTDTVSTASNYSANTFGNSVYFDGTGDYASYTASLLIPGPFTVECWFYNTSTSGAQQTIFAFNSTSGAYASVRVDCDGSNASNHMQALLSTSGSGWTTNIGVNSAYVKGIWNHVAVTRDSSNLVRFFVNGVVIGTATQTGTLYNTSTTHGIGTASLPGAISGPFQGYISNLRMINGQALYTSPFIPSDRPLPTTANTTLLLASTVGPSVADATRNHNIETFGTARYVANNSPYYDTYSAFFDGNGDYLTLPSGNASLQPASSDFTIEAWVYPTAFVTNGNPVAAIDVNGSWYAAIRFGYESSGAISLLMSTNGTTWSIQLGSGLGTLTLNTWQHMAVSKSGTSVRVFLNGVQQGSTQTLSSATLMTGTNNWIGYLNAPSAQYVNGYISNWRLTKTALYTTTFTPSTSPLTAIANTSLLTCQSNRFIDNSTNAFTITKTGDVKITAFEPFANSNNSRFNSVYFPTKTDYLGIRPQPNVITFPGDFTFECWVYPTDTSLSTMWGIWDSRNAGAASNAMVLGIVALASPVTGSWRMSYYNGTQYYGTGTVLWNQWTHVAWARSGTTMTFYVNGVAGGTATISGTQTGNATTAPIYIGSKDSGLSGYGTVGYIADFRITNGAARTITLPTAPYDIK